MTDPLFSNSFASQLLQQERTLTDSQYAEHRRKLEQELIAARKREKLAYWIAAVSGVLSVTLMFVGGSRIIGSFDPSSQDANVLSIAAGIIYVLATVVFLVCVASYYSRFRPGTREARERLRDMSIIDLQRQISEVRRQMGATASSGKPRGDKPQDEPPSS